MFTIAAQNNSKSTSKRKPLERLKTGVKGFDKMLGGGVPKGRTLLITGDTGSAKTVLLNEFIYQGITQFDEPGVFITFEERPEDIKENVTGFGWNYEKLENENKLAFVDFSIDSLDITEVGDYNWAEGALARIEHAIKKVGAKRIAVDNLGVVFNRYSKFEQGKNVREAIFYFLDQLKQMGVTSFVAMESGEDGDHSGRYGVEEYIADAVIRLSSKPGENKIVRNISIKKMRGMDYQSGYLEFEVTKEGLQVFPKIPITMDLAKTEYSVRKKFGIEKLDKALGGGVPQGHMLLIGGNTGTGKTTLGMHFLLQGAKEGEKCVFVNLEESITQIRKTAKEHGWDFGKLEDEGKLIFINSSVLDISVDKLLSDITGAVDEAGATRIVLDSVSTLQSATMNQEDVREFLIQLSSFLKTKGVTAVINYLTPNIFGARKNQLLGNIATNEMRLSSITDGIIMLRYVERSNTVDKLLNILKLRGSKHSKDIYQFNIEKGGFKLGEKFKNE